MYVIHIYMYRGRYSMITWAFCTHKRESARDPVKPVNFMEYREHRCAIHTQTHKYLYIFSIQTYMYLCMY